MPKLQIFNGKKALTPKECGIEKIFEPISQEKTLVYDNSKDNDNNSVIKIIRKEWEKELDRLKNNRTCDDGLKQNQRCLVQSGHAEIEANKLLFIYGNAMEVLKRTEFYNVVEEMHLE